MSDTTIYICPACGWRAYYLQRTIEAHAADPTSLCLGECFSRLHKPYPPNSGVLPTARVNGNRVSIDDHESAAQKRERDWHALELEEDQYQNGLC